MAAPARRAPFSANPQLGARGQRTRQRILDAALAVFGEEGYHQGSIDQIAKRAGCSRVSFYQYFSDKDEVFRELTGQVARQLRASVEVLEPITPDRAGWDALRSWLARCTEIHDRYEPVFNVFDLASESDASVAAGAARWNEGQIARFRASITTSSLPPRQLDAVIALLLGCVTHALGVGRRMRAAAPEAYSKEHIERALTDVVHRTLFGLQPETNVHAAETVPLPPLDLGPGMQQVFEQEAAVSAATAGRPALGALLDAGAAVFVRRGYHGTRVDDLVAAAGVSHGAFYRYFDSKEQLARVLTARALRSVSSVFREIPAAANGDQAAGRAALRRWLRRYNEAHASEAAMIRVFADAALHDAALRADTAPTYEWGRRQMARYLARRGFGDIQTEAIVMVALLGAFGGIRRSAAMVEAACQVIERGLLGL
jgi:AcrR family transcriptional regulator